MSEPAAGFRRQHPLSWIFPALAAVRSTVVPAVLFFVFWQGCAFGWLAVLLVLPPLAIGIARYLALSYSLAPGELVIRDGILRRNERRIRHSRIQNVDEVQGVLHRLLGVVKVRVETASGGEAEALLELAPAAVEELRRSVFERRGGELAADAGPPLLAVPAADLARLGLIRNRGLVVAAAVLGVAFQGASDWSPMPWERFGAWVGRMGTDLAESRPLPPDLGALTWGAGALLLVAGAYLLLSVLSILLALVQFAGFTLVREGDDLTARYGLLSRLRVTVPRRRIQRLQVDESLLHRLWRRLSIRLDTAGGREDAGDSPFKDSSARGRQWLAPVAPRPRLDDLVAAALPSASRLPLAASPDDAPAGGGAGGWRALDPRAAQRLFNRASLLTLFATFGLVWLSRWALVALPVALPLTWWICRQAIAARRFWPTGDALWWRRGWPGRRLIVLPYDKIQSVSVGETPFDRRWGMARVIVDTAGSGLFPAAQIAYLDADEARALGRRLAREAAGREFVWS